MALRKHLVHRPRGGRPVVSREPAGSADEENVRRPAPGLPITVEIAPGELIDKITILKIKRKRIGDPKKLRNVQLELETLESARDRAIPLSENLTDLTRRLKTVNEQLWEIEDEIRLCERNKDFGPRFVELARTVYRNNDRRAELKRTINQLLGSRLVEEKAYAGYE